MFFHDQRPRDIIGMRQVPDGDGQFFNQLDHLFPAVIMRDGRDQLVEDHGLHMPERPLF